MPYIMYQKKAYAGSVADTDSIKYKPQLLTPEQKITARKNIGAIGAVNGYLPDDNGEVNLNVVPYADNLVSPDNYESEGEYIFRSTAGDMSTHTGDANLSIIRGNSRVDGRIPEKIAIVNSSNISSRINKDTFRALGMASGSYTYNYTAEDGWTEDGSPVSLETLGITVIGIVEESVSSTSSNAELVVNVDADSFKQTYPDTGSYVFEFDGTDWTDSDSATVDMNTIGVTISGVPAENDILTITYVAPTDSAYVTVNYTKEERGTIKVAKPTSFRSYGLNQFDKDNMFYEGYTISTSGAVVESAGSYLCYVHAVGGLTDGYTVYSEDASVIKMGYLETKPTTSSTGINMSGVTMGSNISYISVPKDGYIVIATTNPDTLCVHPTWSGVKDDVYEPYNVSIVTIPLEDRTGSPLPTDIYGMPALHSIRDEINYDLAVYIKRIERISYTTSALSEVKAMGVDYDYDDEFIYYVLREPKTYVLAIDLDGYYIADDYGVEEIVGVDMPMQTLNLYGRNLRDYLRVDVPNKLEKLESSVTPLKATLAAGETSVSWTSDKLTSGDVYLEFYADITHKDLIPSDISVSGNTLTVTYNSQSEDVEVGVKITV